MELQVVPPQTFWEFLLKKFPHQLSPGSMEANDWKSSKGCNFPNEDAQLIGQLTPEQTKEAVEAFYGPLGYQVTEERLFHYLTKNGRIVASVHITCEMGEDFLLQVINFYYV